MLARFFGYAGGVVGGGITYSRMNMISDNLIVDSNNADIDDKKDEKY